MSERCILDIRDLCVAQPSRAVPELDHFSLRLNAGACVVVLGEAGSGKEALVRVLGGFPARDDDISGTIAVGGGEPIAAGRKWRGGLRIAYVPSALTLPFVPHVPVLTQLSRLCASTLDTPQGSAREELRLVLARHPDAPDIDALDARPDRLDPALLTWGLLALAVCGTPDMVLADHAFADLGPKAAVSLLAALERERKRAGFAVLCATGGLQAALRLDAHVLVIRRGRVVEEGDRARLESAHAHAYTRQLYRAMPRLDPDQAPPRPGMRGQPLLQAHGVALDDPRKRKKRKRRDLFEPMPRPQPGLTFALCRGGSLAFVGESGSGRRDMVEALLYLKPPPQGGVVFDAVALKMLSQAMLRRLRRRVAFVTGADDTLDPEMTVRGTVEEPLRTHLSISRHLIAGYCDAALKRVGLASHDPRAKVADLSVFDRRRLQIARAIASAPLLVVIDEPLAGLDAFAQGILRELLADLRSHLEAALLVITADFSVAQVLASEVFVFDKGQIVERGATAEVLRAPQAAATKALIAAVRPPPPAG